MPGRFDNLPIAIKVDHLKPNVTRKMIDNRRGQLRLVDKLLRTGASQGSEFIGWLKPNSIVARGEMSRLKAAAQRLASETDVLLVIGIGGSYLGARAVVEALSDNPGRVVYAGQNISADYIQRLRSQLSGKRVAINVISKSGTTTEPGIAFRVLKDLVPDNMAKRWIIATTDANKGALLQYARKEGYETFVVPDNVGGRYSVLSSVGLLPIAYAGIDVDALIAGANVCADLCANADPLTNPAYFYALARNILYHQGISVELLASFEPRLHYFAEWWKQLFGESEGKENMSLFPASVDFTTDLHSIGQYIQEGRRIFCETFLMIEGGEPSLTIPSVSDNTDELNYLAGQEISYVNFKSYEATAKAHRAGGVPNMTVLVEKLDAYSMGALIYFFEIACAVSGLMMGINPFDQPGVEAYKNEMFKLLNKPGYESPKDVSSEDEYIEFKTP